MHSADAPAAPAPPVPAGRRRRLMQGHVAGAAAGGGSAAPEWVRSDPIFQVAAASAAQGMSESGEMDGSATGAPAGAPLAGPRELTPEEEETLALAAEWMAYTAGGGGTPAPAPSPDAAPLELRSLEVSAASDLPPLPELEEYDGSEGRREAAARRRVEKMAGGEDWQAAWVAVGGAELDAERAARQSVRAASFDGPINGTILSWM